MEERRVDVCVIGGGVSGMTAAYRLFPHASVCVVEAKDRLGGRTITETVTLPSGRNVPLDLGGQWVGRTQKRIRKLLTDLGIETYPQYVTGKKLLQTEDGRVLNYRFTTLSMFALSLTEFFSSVAALLAIELLAINSRAHEVAYSTQSAVTFVSPYRAGTAAVLRAIWRATVGIELEDLSMAQMLGYVRSAGSFNNLIETEAPGAQEMRIRGGAAQICRKMAEAIGARNILMSAPVTSIMQDDEGATVTTHHDHIIRSKYVIIAVPPLETKNITFVPPLPAVQTTAIDSLFIGHFIKVVVLYETTFWRSDGMSGEALSCSGPLCYTADATTPCGQPAIVGFVGGRDAVSMRNMSKEDRQAAYIRQLVQLFGAAASTPLKVLEKDWCEESYIGGCPVTMARIGSQPHTIDYIAQPLGRIVFAGTDGAEVWRGYMDGAVYSANKAAAHVAAKLNLQRTSFDSVSSRALLVRYGIVAGVVAVAGYLAYRFAVKRV